MAFFLSYASFSRPLRPRKFLRAITGGTAIEFATLSPIFLLMIMGIIEFSLVMLVLGMLEAATSQTSRLGKTGYVSGITSRQQEIINSITAITGALLDPNKITITTLYYTNLNQIGQPEPCISPPTPPCPGTPGVNFQDINGNGVWDADMGTAGLGNAGDYVVYTVSYPWQIITPMVSAIIGNNGVITLQSRTVVKNEPYSGG